MNEKHVDEIINALYYMIQDARAVPLATDKCFLERDKALDMLDEIINQLPSELKQARAIVESRDELVAQARRESEAIIRQAQEEAAQLVCQQAIYQEAKRQCIEMAEQTKAQLAGLRKASNEYLDGALAQTEAAIAQSLTEIQETRAKFQALTQPAPVEEEE